MLKWNKDKFLSSNQMFGWQKTLIYSNFVRVICCNKDSFNKKLLWKFNGKLENVMEKLVEFDVLKRILKPHKNSLTGLISMWKIQNNFPTKSELVNLISIYEKE